MNSSKSAAVIAQTAPENIAPFHLPDLTPVKPSLKFLFAHPAHFIALGQGSGLSPTAPGTFGTLWIWLLYALFADRFSTMQMAALLTICTLVGIWACSITAERLKLQDPGCIVWDEMLAFALMLWLLAPASLGQQLAAFALFRFFDAIKPGPVAWADELFHAETGWKKGLGIMLDDLVAAFCSLLVIALWKF